MYEGELDEILKDEGLDDDTIAEIKAIEQEHALQEPQDLRTNAEMPWRDSLTPSGRGSAFERWANENLMDGRMERLVVPEELNKDLNLEIPQRRISDDCWVRENAIWDLKAGYETSSINSSQLTDYHKMLDAGQVVALKNGLEQVQSVESVNYLFDTKAGALRNHDLIAGQGSERIFIWYLDASNQPTLLDNVDDFRQAEVSNV